ncbi:MAG: S49 family peptidase [Bacteroidetes bacterium]|jgi:ClpP class serine protease|nr:S49 family peptidase [Bacteroidota bacterium]
MLQPHLVHAILYEPWAISAEHALTLAPYISNVLDANMAFERADPVLPYAIGHAASPHANNGMRSAKQIQVITITGAITKYSQACGPDGSMQMKAYLDAALADNSVDAIVLRIDSPGGMVAGTETFAEAIKNASKPVVAFVDDLAASAGYWLAAASDYIIANNSTAQVGSIGVLSSFQDLQPMFEAQGRKFHTIIAPQSTNKTRLFDKIRAGDYAEYKEQILRPLAAKFIDFVKASRPGATEAHFAADVFYAQDVEGSLIDEIGSFERALQKAADLATESVSSSSLHNNSTMSKTEFKRLTKAANVPALESADGSINLSAEMAQAVETALEASETAQADLQAQLDARASEADTIAQLTTDLQTANDRIAELEKGPGAESAEAEIETDANAGSGDQDDFWSRYHNLKNH